MNEQKWSEWINAGKFADFVAGKRELIVYANTQDMIWHIGVIINYQTEVEEFHNSEVE